MKYIKTRHQIYFKIKENSESGNYRSTLFYNIMGYHVIKFISYIF